MNKIYKAFTSLTVITILTSCQIKDSLIDSTTDDITTSDITLSVDVSSEERNDSSAERLTSDPYIDVDVDEFYKNYTRASSYEDSIYRSKHNLMSGSIDEQSVQPVLSSNQPMDGTKYIYNSSTTLSDDENSYDIMDETGDIISTIYRGGAYVTLDEVSAYLFAFGEIPANYIENKSFKNVSSSPWGKYLRLNHSYFSGDTTKYKYEPEMPDNNFKDYYEIDIGTDGKGNESSYTNAPYNNGSKITRGTCRIVYTRWYSSSHNPIGLDDKYIFYTYNHYNDFQQYLNYEGGWGKRFGNITGGGTLNNSTGIYKTEYPEVTKKNFR